MNYRDLIQLAPEQVERLKKSLRPFSECDNERIFKQTNQTRERTRVRATMGLAEMERCAGEIWKQLLPARFSRGTHRNEEKSFWRNFYFGHCLNLEPHWKKFFPEVWNIFVGRDYYRDFVRVSNHETLKMKALVFCPEWKPVYICRSVFFFIQFVIFLAILKKGAVNVKCGLREDLNLNVLVLIKNKSWSLIKKIIKKHQRLCFPRFYKIFCKNLFYLMFKSKFYIYGSQFGLINHNPTLQLCLWIVYLFCVEF